MNERIRSNTKSIGTKMYGVGVNGVFSPAPWISMIALTEQLNKHFVSYGFIITVMSFLAQFQKAEPVIPVINPSADDEICSGRDVMKVNHCNRFGLLIKAA